jgi:hypothetical protein
MKRRQEIIPRQDLRSQLNEFHFTTVSYLLTVHWFFSCQLHKIFFCNRYLSEDERYASTSRLPFTDPSIVRQIPHTSGPITLTWNPSEGDGDGTAAQSQVNPTFQNAIPVILPPRSPSPDERPPGSVKLAHP